MEKNLKRFLIAQETNYDIALREIQNAKKRSHWMWYIFPQIKGLGRSETSAYYGIAGMEEAKAYLTHPVLGKRLIEICTVLTALDIEDARHIFGRPDDLKLKSSLTLFASCPNAHPVFEKLLNKFFKGNLDLRTLELLK